MAPDGDPEKHRALIKTSTSELTTVLVELRKIDQAVDVCKDLVQREEVQSITLCPGFTHEALAKVVEAVGQEVAVKVARGDTPATLKTSEILKREWRI